MSASYVSKRILYLSYDGMTDALGQSQVLPYLCGLSQLGYQFTIISFEKTDKFEQFSQHIAGLCRQYGIKWIPMTYTKRPPVFSSIYDLVKGYFMAVKLHRQTPFSIVHCRSYMVSLIGLRLKRRFGLKFIFDMRGFWADERVEGKLWNLKNPLYRLIYRFFKQRESVFLNEADATICLTHRAVNEMKTRENLNPSKISFTVIPCCTDMELFNPEKIEETHKKELRSALGIDADDFVLTYTGSLGTWYLLPEMLDFFLVLKTRHPKSKMLFVNGNLPEQALIRIEAEKRGLTSSVIVTQSPYTRMPLYISISNWAIFFILPSFSKIASSPVKQGELMSMGIPVFCNQGIGDSDHIVLQSKAGIVVQGFTTDHYLTAINEALNMNPPPDHKEIRLKAELYFSLQEGIRQYASVYQSVLS